MNEGPVLSELTWRQDLNTVDVIKGAEDGPEK